MIFRQHEKLMVEFDRLCHKNDKEYANARMEIRSLETKYDELMKQFCNHSFNADVEKSLISLLPGLRKLNFSCHLRDEIANLI